MRSSGGQKQRWEGAGEQLLEAVCSSWVQVYFEAQIPTGQASYMREGAILCSHLAVGGWNAVECLLWERGSQGAVPEPLGLHVAVPASCRCPEICVDSRFREERPVSILVVGE